MADSAPGLSRPAPREARPAASLRTRLLLFLLAAVVLFALAQGVTAYRNALQQVDQLFDYQLQQIALSMRSGFVLGPAAPDFDAQIGDNDIVVQIWEADGRPLFRSPRWALPTTATLLGFSDVSVDDRKYRLFTLQTSHQTIQIAQDLSARTARARALAARAVLPIALFAPLLMVAVWWVVSRSLAPVERMRAQVARRAADDLSPLPDADLPAEVQPLVAELNALFGRVHAAFDAQKNFVADAAHELRSPLTALKLQAHALRRSQHEPAAAELQRDAALARLDQGIDRAIRLVGQLLALARAQAGAAPQRLDATMDAIDLRATARLAAGDLLPQAQATGIELEVRGAAADNETSQAAVWVRGDAEALRILIANLLDNAIKYTPAPGRVALSLQTGESSVLLAVDDSGPGIPVQERDRVFDRFFRSPDADAGAVQGSGLGLAIVRAVAERHGATLRLAESPTLGGLRVELGLAAVA